MGFVTKTECFSYSQPTQPPGILWHPQLSPCRQTHVSGRKNMSSRLGPSSTDELARQDLAPVQVRGRSRTPSSKSKQSFNGFGGEKPLQTSDRQSVRTPDPTDHLSLGPPLHAWFDYPPSFKQGAATVGAKVKESFGPSVLLKPLPAELKFAISRNFGFFAKIFTQFFDRDGAENVKQSIGLK